MSTESNSSDPSDDDPPVEASWWKFFRYDSVYENQDTGIENFLDVLQDNGYYSLEGPCGTGKTLIAVTAAIEAMRSDEYPDYQRTGVFTPNKQQLNQFIEEMRGVNRSLPASVDPAPTVVLKGRNEMLPYAFTDIAPFDEDPVSNHIDDLRGMARTVIRFGSDIPLDWPAEMNPPASSKHDYNWSKPSTNATDRRDKFKYDPARAEAVTTILKNKAKNDDDFEQLEVDGVMAPYPDIVPHTRHIVDTQELENQELNQLPLNLQGRFDPFYIGFFKKSEPAYDFTDTNQFVFDREILFKKGVTNGVCPHELMAHFGQEASILLGNYTHIFDPQTRNLTESKMGVLDENTIAVVDEAHRLEEKVQDMLSKSLDLYTVDQAIGDLELMSAYVDGEFSKTPTHDLGTDEMREVKELIAESLDEVTAGAINESDVHDVQELFRFLKRNFIELGGDYLNKRNGSWQREAEHGTLSDEEIPLTSPEFPNAEGKLLEKVTARFENGAKRMEKAWGVFEAINLFFTKLSDNGIHEREPQDVEVGRFWYDWATNDGIDFHRQLKLDRSSKETIPTEYPRWVQEWTPKFELFNCIPTDRLKTTFGQLGSGILMSATLSPPNMFQKVVGALDVPQQYDSDENQSDMELEDMDSRRSEFDQFPLRFPKENRESLIVDLPKFTAGNRGQITTNPEAMNMTRREYVDALSQICNSYGNILVAMPKYAEAEWAYEVLKDRVEKEAFLDESTTNEETNRLLDAFFNSDSQGVIFTSTRGTITEGVDYDGEKLHCCVVVGIPLIDTRPKRIESIQHAYAKKVPERDSFDTAIKIPAVRKARQAIGRVIRGESEVGVRILADERYGSTDWDGASEFLSESEREEFETIPPAELNAKLSTFWDEHAE